MLENPETRKKEEWLLQPRASNELYFSNGRFKAFSRIVVHISSETEVDQGDS